MKRHDTTIRTWNKKQNAKENVMDEIDGQTNTENSIDSNGMYWWNPIFNFTKAEKQMKRRTIKNVS